MVLISHLAYFVPAFANGILERGPTPRQGTKTDHAHPPIHPTKHAANLQGDEQRVYELVVRHFLACCSQVSFQGLSIQYLGPFS